VGSRLLAWFAGSVGIFASGCEFAPSGELGGAADELRDAQPRIDALVVPSGYEPLEGSSSFYRYIEERVELAKAVADCADDAAGTTVLLIEDADENRAIRRLAAAFPTGRQIWLGIEDWHEEGVWRTLAFDPLGFTAWLDGEPNDGGPDGEDCAVLLARFDPEEHEGRWNDVGCTASRAYICEWHPP
jgi:hypothetical protein